MSRILKFCKMHGTGNDYVYVNCFEEQVNHPEKLAIALSDRHFGIGSDGLILIAPSQTADCKMIMYNADGSQGKMCGNGIRCVAKYVYDHEIAKKESITVETASGIKTLQITDAFGKKAQEIAVDMGTALLKPSEIPVLDSGEDFIARDVEVNGVSYKITCVSMGNPHAVIFTEGIDKLDLDRIGPYFENHPLFPDRINTEFVEVLGEHTLKMRVYERGSGETISCGTGTCAAVVAAVKNGYCRQNEEITVQIRGGELKDTYLEDGRVIMKGTASFVFRGEIEVED